MNPTKWIDDLRKSYDEHLKSCDKSHNDLKESCTTSHERHDSAISKLRGELEALKKWKFCIRCDTLYEWIKYGHAETRNELAHGGDIKTDIELLQHVREKNPGHIKELEKAFLKGYDLSANDCASELEGAPDVIIDAQNMRANVTVLRSWQKKKQKSR